MIINEFKSRIASFAGREFIRKSVVSIDGGGDVFLRLLGSRQFSRALEIGTYRGVSSALMAQFCDVVTTIDLIDGKMERDRQVFDRVRFWEAMGVGNITLRLVNTEAEKAEIIDALEFDFAFIDGDHDGFGPRDDFNLVKKCGNVLFHDYSGNNAVARFVDTLPRREVTIMGIFALWTRS